MFVAGSWLCLGAAAGNAIAGACRTTRTAGGGMTVAPVARRLLHGRRRRTCESSPPPISCRMRPRLSALPMQIDGWRGRDLGRLDSRNGGRPAGRLVSAAHVHPRRDDAADAVSSPTTGPNAPATPSTPRSTACPAPAGNGSSAAAQRVPIVTGSRDRNQQAISRERTASRISSTTGIRAGAAPSRAIIATSCCWFRML